MKKILFVLLILIVSFAGCEDEEFENYHSEFYAARLAHYGRWEKDNYFTGDEIAFQIFSSREFTGNVSKVEPLIASSIVLTIDRDIFLNQDTLKAQENIYKKVVDHNPQMVSLQSYEEGQFTRYSILKFNPANTSRLILNEGYYTFYIHAKTINNHILQDSAVVYYRK